MLSSQDSTVLKAIFEAGAGVSGWPNMLRALSEYLHASDCMLFTPKGAWDHEGPAALAPPDSLTGLRLGRVYTGEELMDRALPGGMQPAASDFRTIGLRPQAGICWLLFSRMRGEFRAVDSAALSAIAVHVTQAIDLSERVSGAEAQAARAARLARRIGVGVVAFDRKGQCIALDAVARDLLEQAGMTAHQLTVGQGSVQRVSDMIEMIFPRGDAQEAYLRHTVHSLPDPKIIAQVLGISLAEARLARALGMGNTLAEAAEHLGLTVESARAYSKQIFAKTGLRGQPDLMRRLWTSPLPLF